MQPKISLEQWRALVTVVEAGGYAQAAEALHKTQSSVSYLVGKLESLLDLKVFEIEGRKARLTANGQLLYRRAKALLEESERIESAAATLAAGWEPELRLAVEIIFPTWMLLNTFARFAEQAPGTRLQLHETVLGGTDEALLQHRVHLAINSHVPPGFSGETLLTMKAMAVASADHPLHRLGRQINYDDLRQHRQIVVRDTARQTPRESGGWMGSEQRWTVSNKATAITAVTMGLGFAWYPEEMIRGELQSGALKPLPMRDGADRQVPLYLIVTDGDAAGPATCLMADILREEVRVQCRAHGHVYPGDAAPQA
ncbi:LysR family transcriptional regulator [Hydrocarboniphaga effusa]|uniref:LysR family transcriptional regulator n=1 Tax=Hydrocarboniphaga effusa TaxID=243629 RepID=UPI00398C16B5